MKDTFMLYVPIHGTFSVSTDIENLNYSFLSKFLDTSKLIIMSPWDGAWEIEQIIRNGTIVGHKLFDVPGVVKNAQWSVAYDEENKRVFFYVNGAATFDGLKSDADMEWAHVDVQQVVSDWMFVISVLFSCAIDGSVRAGDSVHHASRDLHLEYQDGRLRNFLGHTRYRFFPEGDEELTGGAGEKFASLDLVKLGVEHFFAGKPVRYEVSHDRGITWEPYTPEEDESK